MRALISTLLLVIILLLVGCHQTDVPKVCFEQGCFLVEVADEDAERMQGLMYREELAEQRGMLFIFEKPEANYFWMKNTLIPLDMIWLNENQEIIYINKETPPCKANPCAAYGPNKNSTYVLEINGGLSDEIGLEVGDYANIVLSY